MSFIWTVCILVTAASLGEARIVKAPESMNVTVGEEVVFTCKAIANIFSWLYNNHSVVYGVRTMPINVNENLRQSTFTLNATSSDNNSSIKCISIILDPLTSDESETVLLLVQDVLQPVTEITWSIINSTTVSISWTAPFTLKGVPILGYNVTITNTTSGENETMSVEGYTTMLYYSVDHLDPDKNFTVTVVPINRAGPGEPASAAICIVYPTPTSTMSTRAGTSLSMPPFSSNNNAGQSSAGTQETTTPKLNTVNGERLRNIVISLVAVLLFISLVGLCIAYTYLRKRCQRCTAGLSKVTVETSNIISSELAMIGGLPAPAQFATTIQWHRTSSDTCKQKISGGGTPGGHLMSKSSKELANTKICFPEVFGILRSSDDVFVSTKDNEEYLTPPKTEIGSAQMNGLEDHIGDSQSESADSCLSFKDVDDKSIPEPQQ